MKRRAFLWGAASAGASAVLGTAASSDVAAPKTPRFATRGVVLIPSDLTLADWPARIARAGLNTIGLHAAVRLDVVVKFVRSEAGERALADCRRLGVNVEYELHAMADLLPRDLFAKDPGMFRVDKQGRRSPDCNCCPSNGAALEVIAASAVDYARLLRPTTHRYFYWPDDGREWCFCQRCRGLSASEQALLVENHILRTLRKHHDPQAEVCHIAYVPTLAPPKQVKPEPGIFVEFAPITRSHDRPLAEQNAKTLIDRLEVLDANLAVFPRHSAQVLEYWLDNSRYSGWRRPAKKLPWNREVFLADLEAYAKRGIRHVTSFACYLDADYVKRHGDFQPALLEYGAGLTGAES
jgi:hypothetical protein